MKWRKVGKVVAITLVILLSPIIFLYGLMRPRDPHFEYKFLEGRKPIQVGIFQNVGGGHDGSEFAVYYWRTPFAEAVRQAKIELAGLKRSDLGSDHVEFEDKNGWSIAFMATRLTKGELTWSKKSDVPDSNYVTVLVARPLPTGLFSELRVIFFSTRF